MIIYKNNSACKKYVTSSKQIIYSGYIKTILYEHSPKKNYTNTMYQTSMILFF